MNNFVPLLPFYCSIFAKKEEKFFFAVLVLSQLLRGKARPLFCSRQKQLCFQLHFVLSSCSAISNNTSSVISREKAKKKRRAHFPYSFSALSPPNLGRKLRKNSVRTLQ